MTCAGLPYAPVKSFAPVTQTAYQPIIFATRIDLPYKNIKEMVAYAKAHPDKIDRGSPGASILTNLAPMAFESMTGIRTTHILSTATRLDRRHCLASRSTSRAPP